MARQAFLQEPTLPLMQRNVIGAGRDSIPSPKNVAQADEIVTQIGRAHV